MDQPQEAVPGNATPNAKAQDSHHGSSNRLTSEQQTNFNGGAEIAIHANDSTWSNDKERIVVGPYEYIESQPGKDIRKQMISAFNAWLHVPQGSLKIITKVIGMLHTASLLYGICQ